LATRAQKTKVGLFLVICGLLAAGGIILISGYKNVPIVKYHIVFKESILGVTKGTMVEYMGVQVGVVDDFHVTNENNAHVDVHIESDKVTLYEGVQAELVVYSYVSGAMAISLSGPEEKVKILPEGGKIEYKPSLVSNVSSGIQDFMEKIDSLIATIQEGLKGMEEGDLALLIDNVNELIDRGQSFIDTAKKTLVDVQGDAEMSLEQFRELMSKAQQLIEDTNETVNITKEKIAQLDVPEAQENINEVLEEMSALAQRLQKSAETLDNTSRTALHEADNIEYTMRQTLRTLTESLDNVRALTEYLKQDPSALVRGKGKPKEGN